MTEEKVAEIIPTETVDVFLGKLIQAADVVTAKLIEVAPDAANAILTLVQAKGVFSLSKSGLLMITGISLLVAWRKYVWPWISIKEQELSPYDKGMYKALYGYIPSAVFILIILFGFFSLLSFYKWVSVFYPEGAIALKALEAAGIEL